MFCPLLADPVLTEEEVEYGANKGQDKDYDKPGQGDACRLLAHDDPERETDPDGQIGKENGCGYYPVEFIHFFSTSGRSCFRFSAYQASGMRIPLSREKNIRSYYSTFTDYQGRVKKNIEWGKELCFSF